MHRGASRSRSQRIKAETADGLGLALCALGRIVVALKLALVPIVFDPLAFEAFTIPKAAASSAMSYLIFAVLVVLVLRERRVLARSPLWPVLGVFLLIATLTTATAVHPYTAMYGSRDRLLGLTSLFDGALLAVSIGLFFRHGRDLVLLAAGILIGFAVTTLYGAVQLAGLDPIHWSEQQLSSTIGNRGPFAAYAAIIVSALACGLLVLWRDLSPGWRWLGAVVASLGAVEVAASGARGPTAALVLGTFSALLMAVRGEHVRTRGRWQWIIGSIVVSIGLVAILFTPAGQRIVSTIAERTFDPSRLALYDVAMREIAVRPLLGLGPDGLVTMYQTLRPPETVGPLAPIETSTHNWLLHYAVGTGLLGALAMVTLTAVGVIVAWRELTTVHKTIALPALIAYMVQGMFNVNHLATEVLFWTVIGTFAITTAATPDSVPHRRARPLSARHRFVLVAPVLAGALASLTVMPTIAANRALAESNTARRAGAMQAAETSAARAAQLDPGRATYWNALGLARSRSPLQAVSSFKRAAETEPYDSLFLLNLAGAELLAASERPEMLESAILHSESAARLDPQNASAHVLYARILLRAGRASDAVRAASRALELRESAEALVIRASAYALTHELDRAIASQREAIALVDRTQEVEAYPLRVRLADFLMQAGMLHEAREIVESVLALVPADAEALRLRTELDRREGR